MLSEPKLTLLRQLVKDASNDELVWTKGYIAGFLDILGQPQVQQPELTVQAVTVKPTILYGTETGNSKKVASGLLSAFKKNKINAKLTDVFQYDLSKIEKERLVLFVVSTQGEGEFPQNAQPFYEYLLKSETNLAELSYAVLGLGDSSYPLFNNAAVLLDQVLAERGGKRLLPLVKADVDYNESVRNWESALQFAFLTAETPSASPEPKAAVGSARQDFTGTITHKVILNDIGSNKETFHIEIEAEDAIVYEPGDALGIRPVNPSGHIQSILTFFDTAPETALTVGDQTKTASEWLASHNILGLSKRSVAIIGALLGVTFPDEVADLADLLGSGPVGENVSLSSLVEKLLPIAPRLYSISSSPEAHEGSVHLTVNLNRFDVKGAVRNGLASGYLADYPVGQKIEFYIHKNGNFRLPAEDRDIIMIGPGTGIAPFRSFLAERDATGAQGRNWLFFGEQHFVQDFYYQTEIQDWLSSGVLTLLDTAFSRDQEEKIYVQDRIRMNGKLFNQWIEEGASIYICGQKSPMSVDVTEAITDVIALYREISEEQAAAVVEGLENEGRFHKDVY